MSDLSLQNQINLPEKTHLCVNPQLSVHLKHVMEEIKLAANSSEDLVGPKIGV